MAPSDGELMAQLVKHSAPYVAATEIPDRILAPPCQWNFSDGVTSVTDVTSLRSLWSPV